MAELILPKFPTAKQSLYADLRKNVQQYFDERGIDPTGTPMLFTKAIILVIAFIGIYVQVLFWTPVWYLALAECALLGGLVATIGFNVMHDGSHGSFSKSKLMNKMAALSVNILGASHYMWNTKHNMLHHSFTNVHGLDDDIEIGIWMRMSPEQKKYAMHKYQHLYFWFLYMQLYIFWVFYTDYKKYFSGKIGDVPIKKMSFTDHLGFWGVKIYHAAVFVALPIYLHGFLPWLAGFLVMASVSGFILSIVFQLAHTVEGTEFPLPDPESHRLPDEFAAHQIKTTANFATNNKLISMLVGGLNFQIEHHLFPNVSHVHYPAISNIVRKVCRQYQIQYIDYPTMSKAVSAHVHYLKRMGHTA